MKVKEKKEKLSWQLRAMKYLAYFGISLVPVYFSNNEYLFKFSSSKMLLVLGMVSLMFVFYLWEVLSASKKQFSFRITPLHIVLIIFLFILTVSSVFGVDPINSFFGRWREGINLILIYALSAFSFMVGFLIKKDKSFIYKLLTFSFLSSVCVALVSYTGSSLVDAFKNGISTIGNSSYTGAYLLFNFCFGFGLFFYYKKYWQKISIIIGIFLLAFSPVLFNKNVLFGNISFHELINNPLLFLGEAKAAVAGIGVSLIIALCFFLIKSSKKVFKITGFAFLLVLFLSMYFTADSLMNSRSSLHQSFIKIETENRFIAWDAAQLNFNREPLLGSGFNNFSYVYQKYFNSDIFKSKSPELYFFQPHNVILEYASNNGVLGLMAYLTLLVFIFLALFTAFGDEENRYRNFKITIIALIFGYFLQNLFGFDTPTSYFMLFLVIGLAIGNSKKEWILTISPKYSILLKTIFSLLLIADLLFIILFVFQPMSELKKWNKAARTEDIKERTVLIREAQSISLLGGVSDSAYLAEKIFRGYSLNLDKIDDSNRSMILSQIRETSDQLGKDIERQPRDVFSRLTYGHLLNLEMFIENRVDGNIWEESYQKTKEAIDLSPKNPEIYSLLAQTYMLKNDFTNTYKYLQKSIEVAPDYKKSYDYARSVLKINSNKDFEKFINNMAKINNINQ